MTSLPGTLLVVDDDEANRDMLSRRLERKGFAVTVAEDGSRAIELVRERPFDLVLLDVADAGPERAGGAARAAAGVSGDRAARDHGDGAEPRAAMSSRRCAWAPTTTSPSRWISPSCWRRIQAQLSLKRRRRGGRPAGAEPGAAEPRADRGQRPAGGGEPADGARPAGGGPHPGDVPPPRRARLPRARFAWHYRPCEELAGDGLNVFALDDRHAALYVFDVSGHGVASALLSVSLSRVLSPPSDPSSVLRPDAGRRPAVGPAPAEVAGRLNRMFPFDEATEQYFTMVYGVLDVASGEFRYVSAGHPGVAHVPASGAGRIVENRGFPIGLARAAVRGAGRWRWPRATGIYLYSDGIPEAMDADGEVFGGERLLRRSSRPAACPWTGRSRRCSRRLGDGAARRACATMSRSSPSSSWVVRSVVRIRPGPRLAPAARPPRRSLPDRSSSSARTTAHDLVHRSAS